MRAAGRLRALLPRGARGCAAAAPAHYPLSVVGAPRLRGVAATAVRAAALRHACGVDALAAPFAAASEGYRQGAVLCAIHAEITAQLVQRTEVLDAVWRQGAAEGITQYVNLGAGMDMRAERLGLGAGHTVYEVDRADVLDAKTAALGPPAARGGAAAVVEVRGCATACGAALRRAGLCTELPSLWTLEGLCEYLAPPQLRSLRRNVLSPCAPPGSLLCLSVVLPSVLEAFPEGEKQHRLFGAWHRPLPGVVDTVHWLTAESRRSGRPWAERGRYSVGGHGVVVVLQRRARWSPRGG
eukprot:TRINITY_DN30340_c0_g1_i2.p1 TRINITY_DN30340_c0_g1~~TRINITY_DN30340_c0_g1_i2.p1  ORF type:complete len:318 (+),score=82.42 TRINITY_DN30340_c0_g1_i2:65-955(+)